MYSVILFFQQDSTGMMSDVTGGNHSFVPGTCDASRHLLSNVPLQCHCHHDDVTLSLMLYFNNDSLPI